MNNLVHSAVFFAVTTALINHSSAQEEVTGMNQNPATQASGSTGTTSYPVEFFANQSPVNAFDLVGLVPGFTFREGDNSRGFSGAAGNVLINGRRPSSKTTGLRMLLRRIPASEIERIDIIRGGAAGIDMQGQPVVVNVIRRSGTSTLSAIEAFAKRYAEGAPGKIVRLEQTRQSDLLLLEGAAEYRSELEENVSGEGRISLLDAQGRLSEGGSFSADNYTEQLNLSGAMEWDSAHGLFRLNITASSQEDVENEFSNLKSAAGVNAAESVAGASQASRIEFGGDYSTTLANGDGLELLALQTIEVEDEYSSRTTKSTLQESVEDEREGETVMRGTWRRQLSSLLDVEGGAEGAFNFLDSSSRLRRNSQNVPLPADTVQVEEVRGEIFSLMTMRPSDSVSLGAGLRAEISKISVSGGAEAENQFAFIKPRLSAAYSTRSGTQLRIGLQKDVGQLDFGDFVAGSEFSSNTVNAGNPDLAPENSWRLEAGIEQPIFNGGAVNISYSHAWINDVVDLVLISGFVAPGNISKGVRDQIELSLTLPFESYGPGLGRIQFDATWSQSEVIDPVTGIKRGISNEKPFEGRLTYTREFPDLNSTFGVIGDLAFEEKSYRVDQIITERSTGNWRAYWDWRPRQNLLLRAQIDNLTSRDLRREQLVYDGLRSSGALKETELRNAVLDPFLMMRLRLTF